MTDPFSRPDAGARISATVKWYNPAKVYGFLVPQDDSPDSCCRDFALAAAGLDTLVAGATVNCETVQRRCGPQDSRILATTFLRHRHGRCLSPAYPVAVARMPKPVPDAEARRW